MPRHHQLGPPEPPIMRGSYLDTLSPSMEEEFDKLMLHGQVAVPTKMQSLSPALVASLPPFQRNIGARMGKANPPESRWIAHVDNPFFQDKRDIKVDAPEMFTNPILAHEATHVWQNTRSASAQATRDTVYDYGGVAGLRRALLEKKSIADFNTEQQADIVRDYYTAHLAIMEVAKQQGGYLYPQQAQWFETYKSAYSPFIRQLVGQPPESEDTAPRKDYSRIEPPAPPVPGLPPSDITHQVEFDPNIAGTLAPIPVHTGKQEEVPEWIPSSHFIRGKGRKWR